MAGPCRVAGPSPPKTQLGAVRGEILGWRVGAGHDSRWSGRFLEWPGV